MRDRVKVICLNRLGHNVGSLIIKTNNKMKLDAKELFSQNKDFIKSMYPTTVKIKIAK